MCGEGLRDSYQICDHPLQELPTFLHLILRPPELHYVTLLGWVREIYDDLRRNIQSQLSEGFTAKTPTVGIVYPPM